MSSVPVQSTDAGTIFTYARSYKIDGNINYRYARNDDCILYLGTLVLGMRPLAFDSDRFIDIFAYAQTLNAESFGIQNGGAKNGTTKKYWSLSKTIRMIHLIVRIAIGRRAKHSTY